MVIVTSFQQPESPILLERQACRALLDGRDLGVGTVLVSERTLCWKDSERAIGFVIDHPHVVMHAVSSDRNIYSADCIYVVLDVRLELPGLVTKPTDSDFESDEEDSDPSSELIFAPATREDIQSLYAALNRGQTLNSDPVMSDEDEAYVGEETMEGGDEDDEDEDYRFEDAAEEFDDNNDIGAGGDTEMNLLMNRLNRHTLANGGGTPAEFLHTNGDGDQNFDDEEFEDAD